MSGVGAFDTQSMAFVESIIRPEGNFPLKYMCMYAANVFEEEEWSLHPFSQVLFAEVASWCQ